MIGTKEFISHTEKAYIDSPNKFGFAFWKYRELIKTSKLFRESNKGVLHFYAINRRRLIYYWSEDNDIIIPGKELSEFDLLYIHSKYSNYTNCLRESHEISRGSALIYDFGITQNDALSASGYYADSFDFDSPADYSDAGYIISNSGENGWHMTAEGIKELTRQSVFDPDLWVFFREQDTKKALAVGICVYDNKTKETELEWIYVHRDHHGKGVGRALIREIVRRAERKSDTIRVGGVADGFYRQCGFTKATDEWLWIKKKGKNDGWWD